MLNITGGPPLKRQQPLSPAIKHPLGRAPVAGQLLTWLVPRPVRESTLSDALKDGLSRSAAMFLLISQSRPPLWMHFYLLLSDAHFLAFSSLFLSRAAISHMVANRPQQCVRQNRGSGGKRLNLKGCNSVNMSRTRRRRRALARPVPRCDTAGAGGGRIGNVRV